MDITKLTLEVYPQELKKRFESFGINRSSLMLDIEDAKVELEEDRIVVSCTLNPAFCPRTPARIEFSLSADQWSQNLVLALERIDMQISVFGFISINNSSIDPEAKIMEAISCAVHNRKGFTVEGNKLMISPWKFLEGNNLLSMSATLCGAKVSPSGISVQFS